MSANEYIVINGKRYAAIVPVSYKADGTPNLDNAGAPAVNTVIAKGDTITLATHTATGAAAAVSSGGVYATFQATANDAGGDITVGVVDIEVSNDNASWIVMGTISVTTNGTTDGFASSAAWKYTRSNCKTITETGSTPNITVTMGG